MKIGVFDSGVGGQSVVNAIHKAMPDADLVYRDDNAHVPYGTRPIDEIYGFVLPILRRMVEEKCAVIVIACNTVSTNLIHELRAELPVPLIAMEPMIKPAAAQSKSGIITVCATPRTLSSERYNWLKSTYAADIKVLEPDCSDWSALIEDKRINRQHIEARIKPALHAGSDVIVLGCTHYHWIEEEIRSLAAGRATVLQPEQPVIARLQHVLRSL